MNELMGIPAPLMKEQFTASVYAQQIDAVFGAAEASLADHSIFSPERTSLRWVKIYAKSPRYAPKIMAAIAAQPAGTPIDWRKLVDLVISVLEAIPVIGPFATIAKLIFDLIFPEPTLVPV